MQRLGLIENPMFLFDLHPEMEPALTVDPGEEVEVMVNDSFNGERDLSKFPTPFTPEAAHSHFHMGPIAGPIAVRGAEPGDALVVDILSMKLFEEGVIGILRYFGWLQEEFPGPDQFVCKVRDNHIVFEDRIKIPIRPSLGTFSTAPATDNNFGWAGVHGGDMDMNTVGPGSTVTLPVFRPGALLFLTDSHARIGDAIISGTGVECGSTVHMRINLKKNAGVERPIIVNAESFMVVGFGESTDAAISDAARGMVDYLHREHGLDRRQAYGLLAVADARVGTSPRPMMAARIELPRTIIDQLR